MVVGKGWWARSHDTWTPGNHRLTFYFFVVELLTLIVVFLLSLMTTIIQSLIIFVVPFFIIPYSSSYYFSARFFVHWFSTLSWSMLHIGFKFYLTINGSYRENLSATWPWSLISSNLSYLHRVEGILNQQGYHSILQRKAFPSGKRLIGGGFVFQ